MRLHTRIMGIILTILVLFSITGCGGQPVAFADLPVHPDAQPLQAGQNTLADSVANSFTQSVSSEKVKVDLQLYAIPEGTSWDQIKSFYADKLGGTDWKAASELNQDSEAFKTVGWTRGGFAGEQGLAIGYGPDLLGEGAFLMVALISE